MSELEATKVVVEELTTVVAEQERHIRDLQRALWIALHDRGPIEVKSSTPRLLVWLDTEDGGRLVRRG